MTNNQLTDDRIAALLDCVEMCEDMSVDENAEMATALRELQERRKADSEPVAWMHNNNDIGMPAITVSQKIGHYWMAEFENVQPLYRHAQPAPVVPDDVLKALQKVARIRLDMDGFDGDRRGIADCLCDAEEALIEVVNRRAAILAAAPQDEAKKDKPHNNFGTGARLTNHRFKV